MNYIYQAACLLFVLTTSCQSTISSLSTPEHVRLGDQEMSSFAKEVKATNNLQLLGMGGGFLNRINKLSLTFSSEEAPTVDEARMIFFDLSTRFLSRVNQNEEIRPYLVDYPFTIENLELMILFFGETPGRVKGVSFSPPYKHIWRPSYVLYSTDNLSTKEREISFRESYEEGLERFQKQQQEKQAKK